MDPISEAIEHHLWAMEKLIGHLRSLPSAASNSTAPGVYGDVMATLSHMVDADGRYLRNLEGRPPIKTGPDDDKLLDKLGYQLELQSRRWRELMRHIADVDITLPARGERPELPHATNLLLVQALHHGNDHRTEICTILTSNGFAGPDLSAWAYWLEKHKVAGGKG
ncbi:MAG TPA: hypothetical protein VF337_08960 [Candidatus Limnocylindrales bacterium]